MSEDELDQDRLWEVLRYEPDTGKFFWLKRPGGGARTDLVGKQAGCVNDKNYRVIMIDSKEYAAHRLAWLYVYGDWPANQIDHINRNRTDNRIVNLREATGPQNCANAKARSSRSGLKGAHWNKRYGGKWSATIHRNGRAQWLGYFSTAKKAHTAYCKAAKGVDKEFFYPGTHE
jgi:hypothetical protein